MCLNKKQTLVLTYEELYEKLPGLARYLMQEPSSVVPILNAVAFEVLSNNCIMFDETFTEVFV
jgi:hypothetical protein